MKPRIIPTYLNNMLCNDYGVVYFGEIHGKFLCMGFSGKRSKNDFYYSYSTKEAMCEKIEKYLKSLVEVHEYKQAAKKKQKEANENVKVNVGDIFVTSWGYDQTNVDFYQVVEVKAKTVIIKSIASKTVEGSSYYDSCRVKPIKDKFIEGNRGETLTKRILGYNGKPYLSMEFGSARLVEEGQDFYCSWGR